MDPQVVSDEIRSGYDFGKGFGGLVNDFVFQL